MKYFSGFRCLQLKIGLILSNFSEYFNMKKTLFYNQSTYQIYRVYWDKI